MVVTGTFRPAMPLRIFGAVIAPRPMIATRLPSSHSTSRLASSAGASRRFTTISGITMYLRNQRFTMFLMAMEECSRH